MRKSCLILMLLALLLAGCDGSGWKTTIPAKAYPSGNILELNVGARTNPGEYAAYGASRFRSELTMSEIVSRGGSENFTVEPILCGTEDAGVLLTVQREKERQDLYWLTPTGGWDDGQWYRFTGLRYALRQESDDADDLQILFPAFALDAADLDENAQELILGHEYHCNEVTIGENVYPDVQRLAAAFYHASGWYDVEQSGNTLVVQEKGKDAAALWLAFDSEDGETRLTVFCAK